MELNEYQVLAGMTCKSNVKKDITYFAMGLCGEAGEVIEHIKKWKRDGVLDKDKVAKELGDVLWYVAMLSDALDTTLNDVASDNLVKLQSRKNRNKIGGNGDER